VLTLTSHASIAFSKPVSGWDNIPFRAGGHPSKLADQSHVQSSTHILDDSRVIIKIHKFGRKRPGNSTERDLNEQQKV